MKQHGTIAQWRPDKGFGFIMPDDQGDDIFVHASSMVMDFDPAVGQRVTFEVEKSLRDGKLRAIRVVLAQPAA